MIDMYDLVSTILREARYHYFNWIIKHTDRFAHNFV